MKKSEMIAELIANCEVWDESDEAALNAMPDGKLKAVFNHHTELQEAKKLIANADDDMDDEEEEEDEEGYGDKMPAKGKKPAKGKVPPQFLKNEEDEEEIPTTKNAARRLTPDELADIQWAREQRQQIRNELVEQITANEASDFSDEYLASRSMDELKGLAKLATANSKKTDSSSKQPLRVLNYSGVAGHETRKLTENFASEDPDMAPPTIDWTSQARKA